MDDQQYFDDLSIDISLDDARNVIDRSAKKSLRSTFNTTRASKC
jgi:hypothetical protein